jgi:hypothetical protein
MDFEKLARQVKLNCNISDAQFWGYYSICGLLMRLRELYRDEKSLDLWERIPRELISEWIGSTETLWKNLEGRELEPLEIDGRLYDPFEVDGINRVLASRQIVYAAGYGRFNKPTFFLAELSDKKELYDYRIYYAGKELCRDLSTSVAMLQGRCIFMRLDCLKALVWDKFQELRARRFGGLLREAFSSCGIQASDKDSGELFGRIRDLAFRISDIFLFHELGEAYEDERSEEWLNVLHVNRDRSTEFYMRAVKDVMADTSDMGPLKHLIETRDVPLLNFQTAFMDGLRRELFPEMMNSFQIFVEKGDWSVIEEARRTGYGRAADLREHVLRLWKEKKEDIVPFIKEYVRDTAVFP